MFRTRSLDLPPLNQAGGTVRLPGSKSISNRLLLLAGLCSGTTVIRDLLASDDTQVMLDALRTLGCAIDMQGDAVLSVGGLGGRLRNRKATLYLGNAGTAMRPLAAALAVLAATQDGEFELSGVARMRERPIGDLVDALRRLGCRVDYLGNPPPLRLGGGDGNAALDTGSLRVRGDVSSQFLSALLLALPLLCADRAIAIDVDGPLISKPYVGITLLLLARFGIDVVNEDWRRFTIPARSRYESPGDIRVEGDASSASYFIALGAIAAVAMPLRIEGVGLDSIQGDIGFVDAARAMGAAVAGGPGWLEVRRGHWPLRAISLDCNAIPDAAMTLAVMALYASGTTRLSNIGSWRVKETDRIAAMAAELGKLGATVKAGDDFIEVAPPVHWKAVAVDTYDDHRIAMCFALAAFNGLTSGEPPVGLRINDPGCVAKTFPDYFETLFGVVGADAEQIPVLTVDGPTASGKGTLASAVARALGYHYLDSGALYRATALAALQAGVAPDDEGGLARLAASLELRFDAAHAWLGGVDVGDALRSEAVGTLASRISVWPEVRRSLLGLQLSYRRIPGLVADGRDMGTVVFPTATLKVFLTASTATRAERRHNQLISKGISANIADLRADLEARDDRDKRRSVAPLEPADGALLLDNSLLSIEVSVEAVLAAWHARRPFGSAL